MFSRREVEAANDGMRLDELLIARKLAMTGPEAERVGRRLGIHLRRNEFAACLEIVLSLRDKQMAREFKDAGPKDRIPIAELLGSELRYINKLEEAGYIYIEDLDDVDLMDLTRPGPLHLSWFGKNKGVGLVERAREKAAAIREKRRKAQTAKELKMAGDPLPVEVMGGDVID